ncbi:MAG: glycerol-3-phosphate 1-O-acyltransferase PlsY [Cypionkella sp.]|nr:glycerol-3-phosphate 1-O-acyltransferase PlsY [Cypionkella sp.]
MPLITTDPMILALVALLAYALGAVPFGVVVTRAMGLGDVRAIGSGNIGATNVLRTGNKGAALATLILDGAKGGVAVLIARAMFGEDAAQIAGLAAFLGHLFPVWLGFKGGKGVATFFGVLIALAWPVGLATGAVWLAVFAASRISSLSALAAAGLSGFITFILGGFDMLALALVLTLLIFARHSANIARLRAGTEPRFGAK